jgi:putative ABC transport system substrate-binding protein
LNGYLNNASFLPVFMIFMDYGTFTVNQLLTLFCRIMKPALKRLVFSLSLIVLAAAVLLWSDRHNRHGAQHPTSQAGQIPVALLQHSSNPMMEEIHQGIIDGLHQQGYDDGKKLAMTFYNAENDLPTGNLIAQKITGGDFRLAITISTVMLQALSNANRTAHIPHVFGAVTAPVTAGVGINALESLDKPAYLTGIGTPQPVADIFQLAKRINPGLKTVGAVWNPVETNSEYCTRQARQISGQLGITLLEAPVEQSKDVREAAASLVARGVQAFWTGCDATVIAAVDSLTEVAIGAKIPVFSNVTGHALHGSLFDLGADYHEVGMEIGRIAAQVLSGTSPAQLPVKAFVPKRLILNEKTQSKMRDTWAFTQTLYEEAGMVVQRDGQVKKWR